MLAQFGTFDEFKESFYDSIYNPNKKDEFLAWAPTRWVLQPSKVNHKIMTTVDYSGLNPLFSRGNNLLPPIHEKVAELRAWRYVLALDISRQYFQVYSINPSAQCILYRKNPQVPIMVYRHRGLIMGSIYSSNLAGSCTIDAGSIFHEMISRSREQKLDMKTLYTPLAAAMESGNILDPNQLPLDYSL